MTKTLAVLAAALAAVAASPAQVPRGGAGRASCRDTSAALDHSRGNEALNYKIGKICFDRAREILNYLNHLGPRSSDFLWKWDGGLKMEGAGAGPPILDEYEHVARVVQKAFNEILRKSGRSRYKLLVEAHIFEAQNLVDSAVAKYSEAGAHGEAGQLLADHKRFHEARQSLELARSANPADDAVAAELAKTYVECGEPYKAIPIFTDLVQRHSGNAALFAGLGKAQLKANRPADAVHSLQKAIALNPSLTHLHYQLALAHRAMNEMELTEKELISVRPPPP